MRDILLNELRNKFNTINSTVMVEARGNARSDARLVTESKKQFPHLTESQILENRRILDNINFFKLTVKEIQAAYPGMKFAEARAFQKAAAQFAILEYHSRSDVDEETYLKNVNESSKVILELEPFTGEDTIDPNSPEAKQLARIMAATKGKGPEDTIGPKMDFSSGEEAPEPEKKKGFFGKLKDKAKILSGLKNFIKKAANFVVEIAKSKETHKALAIGAVMVVLSVLAPAIPGGAVILGAAKGILGLYSVFKGSKGMLKQGKELSGGKPGMEGVKEYLKNVKNVKAAATLIGQIAQIGIGAWGASSAAGQIMKEIKVSAAEQTFNKAGAPEPTATAKPAAPAEAPKAPEAPAAAPPDISKYSAWGMNKAEQIQSAIQDAAMGKGSMKEILDPLAEKIGAGVANGAITKEQGVAALEGLAKGVAQNNGGIPYKSLIAKLLSVAKLG